MWRSELIPGLSRFLQGFDSQSPQDGWERVSWGQSFDTVQRMYVDAVEKDGNLVLESGDDLQRQYSITFGFDRNHQLATVTLDFEGSQETADYSAIARALNQKLGAPVKETATSLTWEKDQTQAELSSKPGDQVVLSELV